MLPAIAILLLIGVSSLPWAWNAMSRFGARPGALMVAAATMVVLLWLGVLATVTGLPLAGLVGTACVVAAGTGVGGLIRHPPARLGVIAPFSAGSWAAWLGALVWIVVLIAARWTPDAAALGWALAGDAHNNIDLARVAAEAGGVPLGSEVNPAPLMSLLFVILGGADDSISHDIEVVAVLWTAGIVSGCVLCGVAACMLIDPRRSAARAVVAATASLLPLTGAFGALPAYWGFPNTAVMMPVVLAAWIATLDAARAPVVAVATNLLLTTVTLAGWGPLAVLPLAGAVAVAVRFRRVIRVATGPAVVVALVALAQLGAFLAVVVILPLLSSRVVFETPTIGFPVLWPALVVLVVLVALAGTALGRREGWLGWVAATWSIAAALSAAGTLILARGDLNAYYPAKVAWFLVFALTIAAIGLAAALLSRTRSIGMAIPAVLAVALTAAWPWSLGAARPLPAVPFAGGLWAGGGETERLVAYATRADAPVLLWRTGFADEGVVDFWVLLEHGGRLGGDGDLRMLAFQGYWPVRAGERWQGGPAEALCHPLESIPNLRIVTADPGLDAEIAQACGLGSVPVSTVLDSRGIG